MGGYKIINLGYPQLDYDAANKTYVDYSISNSLPTVYGGGMKYDIVFARFDTDGEFYQDTNVIFRISNSRV